MSLLNVLVFGDIIIRESLWMFSAFVRIWRYIQDAQMEDGEEKIVYVGEKCTRNGDVIIYL